VEIISRAGGCNSGQGRERAAGEKRVRVGTFIKGDVLTIGYVDRLGRLGKKVRILGCQRCIAKFFGRREKVRKRDAVSDCSAECKTRAGSFQVTAREGQEVMDEKKN